MEHGRFSEVMPLGDVSIVVLLHFGFIEYYLIPVSYPSGLPRGAQGGRPPGTPKGGRPVVSARARGGTRGLRSGRRRVVGSGVRRVRAGWSIPSWFPGP
jgi:hypothetical protein